MFQSPNLGAAASTDSSTQTTDYEELRHMLFGSITCINSTIHFLHKRGYAEPNDWATPIRTGKEGEWMTILVKRVPID
ncbi:MAG TPA: hypothetical protein V6D29_10440 [Leptolyngbyaceae cyanobacterium]